MALGLPGLNMTGGTLAPAQNPVSGARDVTNQSESGEAQGYAGSVINNFSFGQSSLTSKFGAVSGGSELSTLLWIVGLGVVAAVGWYFWKGRK